MDVYRLLVHASRLRPVVACRLISLECSERETLMPWFRTSPRSTMFLLGSICAGVATPAQIDPSRNIVDRGLVLNHGISVSRSLHSSDINRQATTGRNREAWTRRRYTSILL